MKKLKPFHSTLTAITAVSAYAMMFIATPAGHAAITWGPITDTPTTLIGSADWNGAPAPETATILSPGGYWWVTLTFDSTVKSYSVTYDLQHAVAPHPSDILPADIVELGNIFPKVTGSGMATGYTLHGSANHNGHTDTGMIHEDALAGGGVHVEFMGVHTPEAYVPESPKLALFACLGLVGYIAKHRLCRHTD
jgi:hypothetical protein